VGDVRCGNFTLPARGVHGFFRRRLSVRKRLIDQSATTVRSTRRNPLEHSLTGKLLLAYDLVMADVFEALATPARRAILDELLERDGQTLFELCARLAMKHDLGLTRQAISQHLDVLESAGFVTTRREGRYKFHYLNTDPLKTIVERWLTKKSGRKGADP
jgi:DNA-binding transcriptional ArsR family regulator